jgi:nicotinate phosphoribosyltransferase
MDGPTALYRPSLALLTDLYELTMAYGYWQAGVADREAVFDLTFRKNPFGGGYTIACGQSYVVDFVTHARFDDSDITYLAGLRGNDEQPLFARPFLDWLQDLRLSCDLDAVPEGTVVFPHEPLVRVRGPLITCQLLETSLLNLMNFQTLIATKAARICQAARGEPVMEFGLRRAQGMDGGLAASRAAYIGGCASTSNVLAGKLFGIPVSGTHAHSWVMAFESELEAFTAYADAMPNNCIFLVDTYDTLEGVRRAAAVGRRLRERGHRLVGIRLDSGDLAYLSIQAREILDAAGLPDARIVASNELDEHIIASLKEQGAQIGLWGVGTRLVTAHDEPALGGVYKMTAIRRPGQPWRYTVKLSEQAVKVTTPGVLQVRRFERDGEFMADMIYDESRPLPADCTVVDPADMTRRKHILSGAAHTDLLVPMFRAGQIVGAPWTIADARRRVQEQLGHLHPGIRRFVNPHEYPVGLERSLHELKTVLILKSRTSDPNRDGPGAAP